MYRGVYVALVGLVASSVLAQTGWTITVDKKCEALEWDSSRTVPWDTQPGTAVAEFTLTASGITPLGWTIDWYEWDGYEEPPEPGPLEELLRISSSEIDNEVEARAYTTGLYKSGCTVHYTDPQTGPGTFRVTTMTPVDWVLVVGGALEFGVKNHYEGTTSSAPKSDNDFIVPLNEEAPPDPGAWYLQKFDYPVEWVLNQQFSNFAQKAQYGLVWTKMEQWSLTDFFWLVDAGAEIIGGNGASEFESDEIWVGATGQTANGAISVDLGIVVTFDGELFPFLIEADDWPTDYINNVWETNTDLYRFTGHKPKTIVAFPWTFIFTYVKTWMPDLLMYVWGYWAVQNFELKDEGETPMPAIWVQERFTFGSGYHWGVPLPPPLIGGESFGHIYKNGETIGFKTNWATGFTWVTHMDPEHMDVMHGYWEPDNLVIRTPVVYRKVDNPNSPWFNFSHHYYAATSVAAPVPFLPEEVGVFLETYILKMWTDFLIHNP